MVVEKIRKVYIKFFDVTINLTINKVYPKILPKNKATVSHKIFEANTSFHVKQHTTGKF